MKNIRKFLVVDDHTIIRSALRSLLHHRHPGASIVECATGKDVVEFSRATLFDLAILDLQMPGTEMLDLILQLRVVEKRMPILVYSMSAETVYGLHALKVGARGFVSKESTMEELELAIETLLAGRFYINPNLAEAIVNHNAGKHANPFTGLSPRELQILRQMLSGTALNAIAVSLGLAQSTVGTHKARIFAKLGIGTVLSLKELSDVHHFQ